MDISSKKVLFLGDSITEGHGASDKANCYVSLIAKAHPTAQVFNYGIGGTRIAAQTVSSGNAKWEQAFYTRVEKMEKDADLVCVFGGTNDFGHGDAPMGKLGDKTHDTFYGALYELSEILINRYPSARIAFFTPLHRRNEDTCKERADGKWTMQDYVNAVRQNAEYFGFPLLDLWATSGMQPAIPVNNERFFTDALHPNDTGYQRLFELVDNFIKNLA